MMQGINRIGKGWVGRVVVVVLFAFLILSFAIWGIGDIFRGTTRTQVATVGGIDITAEQFRNAYNIEYQNLIRRARRSITPEQARALGLEARVLSRLVAEAAMDQETRRLGLQVPDELVVRSIRNDPAFQGVDGQFDPAIFADTIRQSGLSEAQYLRDQRLVLARQMVAESVTGAQRVPLAMREAVHRYGTERRSAEVIRLGPALAGAIEAPGDADLQTFYDERKASFRAPEYRSLNVMVLDPNALAKPETVSEADAREYFGRVRDARFGQPERRAIQQILFPAMADAEAAAAKIKAGTTFEAIASERGIDEGTLNLGTLSRAEVIDPAVAEAAFALAEGAVSAPVAGRFGPLLLRVAKIEPGTQKSFEEVALEVKTEIARERAREQVQTIHDAVEDQRASAKPLADIARERDLPLVAVASVDRAGRDKAGQLVETIPVRDAVLPAAFRGEVGSDAEPVAIPTGGYVWFDVTRIEPARDRPLAEIRARVEEEWRKAEIGKALADKARSAVERLDKGDAAAAVAGDIGLQIETVSDLARGQAKGDLTPTVIARIFATPVGRAAATTWGDDGRVAFKVTGAAAPPFVTTTQESAATEERLRTLLADDQIGEYVADVQKRIGVTTYPNNVRRAIGGES